MKKQIIITLMIIAVIAGCKSNKIVTKTPEQEGVEKKVEVACKKEELKDSKSAYRGFGIGQSVNEQESMRGSIDNAHAALAQKIIELAQITSTLYAQNYTLQEKNEFNEQVQRQNTLSSKTFIANAKTICSETYKTSDNLYKTYACIEMEADAEKKYFEDLIKNSASMSKLKYDAALYEKAHKEAIDEFTKEYEKKTGQ